mmetsp:Transcript_32873/g.53388  ORF Transcript_32873/g.53388 Transcript_32873/m.53388 type:complete len:133 (+) Transcript_32873:272-670(+)
MGYRLHVEVAPAKSAYIISVFVHAPSRTCRSVNTRDVAQLREFDKEWRGTYSTLAHRVPRIPNFFSVKDDILEKLQNYFRILLEIDCVRPMVIDFLQINEETTQYLESKVHLGINAPFPSVENKLFPHVNLS